MHNEEVSDLKQDEKAILDNSVSVNSGRTQLKTSGQSTLDNSKNIGISKTASFKSKPGDKSVEPNKIITEEKDEEGSA